MLNNEGQKIDTPVNFYGESKLAGEKYIQSINPEAIIVRTNFFGINFLKDSKKTFFDTLINSLSNNLKIKGFSNIYFTPISILELCKSLGVLMTCDLKGIVNICGNKRISKFQFCLEAAKVINCDSDLIIDTKFVPNSVFKKRPFDMSMDNSVYVKETGHQIPNYDKMLEKEYSLSKISIKGYKPEGSAVEFDEIYCLSINLKGDNPLPLIIVPAFSFRSYTSLLTIILKNKDEETLIEFWYSSPYELKESGWDLSRYSEMYKIFENNPGVKF
jgi:hypothetical protein